MRNRIARISLAIAVVLVSLTAVGCAHRLDCQAVCSRYQTCFDEDYDVDGCVDVCVDESKNSEEYAEDVDSCKVCVDDKSCTGSFTCAPDCAGIVP